MVLYSRYQSFYMVPLLTHIYMEGHNSLHTILEFIAPFSLITFISLITTVRKIHRGSTSRGLITSLVLLLVSITLPILYVSMMMSKSPAGSVVWDILILALTILLTVSVIALFLVDMTFFDNFMLIIDRRRSSRYSSRLAERIEEEYGF